jgi:hypothetical protein
LVTFAVVGHNESERLANALEQAHTAQRPGEPVWFVDSLSSDGSAELARGLGAEVLGAPLGKGRAVSVAAELCPTRHLCVIDADLESTDLNVGTTLREALEQTGADQVVAEFDWPEKSFRPATTAIWEPLARRLFPEAVAAVPGVPLSGFRVFDVALARAHPLPPGFGLEVHLNAVGAIEGRRTALTHIGRYSGSVRNGPGLPRDVGTAVLDLAEAVGRLGTGARPAWDEWLETVLGALAETADGGPASRARLAEAAARPLPPPFVAAGRVPP